MSDYIRGKVEQIVSKTEVLLTLDGAESAREGMEFVVYEEGSSIRGADGEVLGTLELQKARIKLTRVQPEFAVAESAETTKIYIGPDIDEPVDYWEDYDYEATMYRVRAKPIAAAAANETGSHDERGNDDGERGPSLRDLLRSELREKLVVVGDLVRSASPVG